MLWENKIKVFGSKWTKHTTSTQSTNETFDSFCLHVCMHVMRKYAVSHWNIWSVKITRISCKLKLTHMILKLCYKSQLCNGHILSISQCIKTEMFAFEFYMKHILYACQRYFTVIISNLRTRGHSRKSCVISSENFGIHNFRSTFGKFYSQSNLHHQFGRQWNNEPSHNEKILRKVMHIHKHL